MLDWRGLMKYRIVHFLDIFKLLSNKILNGICFSLAEICPYARFAFIYVHVYLQQSVDGSCTWFEFHPLVSCYRSRGIRLYTMK